MHSDEARAKLFVFRIVCEPHNSKPTIASLPVQSDAWGAPGNLPIDRIATTAHYLDETIFMLSFPTLIDLVVV